jgi:hypothetical protein
MQVTLKQAELVVAVRQYIQQRGFSLQGMDVDVKFSATRSADTGIVAMIDIDEADLPPMVGSQAPELQVVKPTAQVLPITSQKPAAETPKVDAEVQTPAGEQDDGAGAAEASAGDAKPKSSLFS